MSSHALPMGLTRGYSNSYTDTLIHKPLREDPVVLTNQDLDRLDEDQAA